MLTFFQIESGLGWAAQRIGIPSADAYYLFEAYDAVPDAMPGTIAGVDDWMDYWCLACADAILSDAAAAGWDGCDVEGDRVVPRRQAHGEGPAWCPRCDVYLHVGLTGESIGEILSHWYERSLTADCLPEICDGLAFYGDGRLPRLASAYERTRRTQFRALALRAYRKYVDDF